MKPEHLRTASCLRCRMYTGLCLCAATPQLDLATRVIIFMHHKEYRLITNTGVLANRVLKNSCLVFRGRPDQSVVREQELFSPDEKENTFLLYPSGEAKELNEDFIATRKGPFTLICPDGHWSQAKKILRHEPALSGIPCLKLPEGQITRYRLRRNLQPGRVCTFEAVTRALGIIEGPHVQTAMETIFEKMVSRILWTRGKISADQVIW